MKSLTTTCFLALLSFAAQAQEVVLESPVFAADCAADSTLTRSGQSLKILLPTIVAQLDAGTIARKRCTMAVPFVAPPGLQVGVETVTVEATASLGRGTRATLSAEAFLASGKGVVLKKSIRGPRNLSAQYNANASTIQWSRCGGAGILRLNASIVLQGKQPSTLSMSEVGLAVKTRPCQMAGTPGQTSKP
jgi:hypothetical protein